MSERQKQREAEFSRFVGCSEWTSCFTPPHHTNTKAGGLGGQDSGRGSPFADRLCAGPAGGWPPPPTPRPPALAPGPHRAAPGRVYSAPAAGLPRPGRRLHPRGSPGRVGLPCGPPDTHRPARPNRGPGPGCRGRRGPLLRAAPAPLRAPHARAVRPSSCLSAPPGSGLSSPLLQQLRGLLVRPAPSAPLAPPPPLCSARPAHPARPGLGGCGRRSRGEPGGGAGVEPDGDAHAELREHAHAPTHTSGDVAGSGAWSTLPARGSHLGPAWLLPGSDSKSCSMLEPWKEG